MIRKTNYSPWLLLCSLLLLLPDNPAAKGRQIPESSGALPQFTSEGHVLGFQPSGVLVAGTSHALHIGFIESQDTVPDMRGSKNDPAGGASYREIWNGVSAHFDKAPGAIMKSTFEIEPGTDPARIRLHYNSPVRITEEGTLSILLPDGEFRESAPIAWQIREGKRELVPVSYRQSHPDEIGFSLPAYDRNRKLFIDPTLTWVRFLGSACGRTDFGEAVTADSQGNVYVAGTSGCSWGKAVRPWSGLEDAFIAKYNSSKVLLWTTFLGSGNRDYGTGITLDSAGNLYLSGYSNASWGTPVRAFAGGWDAFLAKINSDGELQWNTFLGSSRENDYTTGVNIDPNGNLLTIGYSYESWGTPLRAHAGDSDIFLSKISASGVLVWNTFFGSSDADYGIAVDVDPSGNILFAGTSYAGWGSPIRSFTAGSGGDAFAAKVNGSGALQWNTFLGSSDYDYASSLFADSAGNLFLTGSSYATWGNPVRSYSGQADAFVAKLASNGALTWNSFLGSSTSDEHGRGIAVDSGGNIFLAGTGYGHWGSPLRAYTGDADIFVAKLGTNGNLTGNTFLGSSGTDQANGIALAGSAGVYVAGYGDTTWGTPLRQYTGGEDAVIVKVDANLALQWNTFLGNANDDDTAHALTVSTGGYILVVGTSNTPWGNAPVRAFTGPGKADVFVAKLDSAGTLRWHTFLGSVFDDQVGGVAVDSTENVYIIGTSSAKWSNPSQFTNGNEIFLAKLNGDGRLLWETYFGSTAADYGHAITLDGERNLYITGVSNAAWTANCLMPRTYTGGAEAFVAKLNNSGAFQWLTFLGSSGNDTGRSIVGDSAGNIYVAGDSTDSWGSPIRAFAGGRDAFVAKIGAATGALQWNTFLGSSSYDDGYAIALDGSRNIFVGGESEASWGSPVREYSGVGDAYVAKLNNNGALLWNTFLGSASTDWVEGLAVNGAGSVIATGLSYASWGTPFRHFSGSGDGFLAKLAGDKGSLQWNTFLGSEGMDSCHAVLTNSAGTIFTAGDSQYGWSGTLDAGSLPSGHGDAFVAQVGDPAIVTGTPRGNLDTPANNASVSGLVTISGWAAVVSANQAVPAGKVELWMDQQLIGSLAVDVSRADVRQQLATQGITASTDLLGFSVKWNSSRFANGNHQLSLLAYDATDTGAEIAAITVRVANGTSTSTTTSSSTSSTRTTTSTSSTLRPSTTTTSLRTSTTTTSSLHSSTTTAFTIYIGSSTTTTTSTIRPGTTTTTTTLASTGNCSFYSEDFSTAPSSWGFWDGANGPNATWTWIDGQLDVDDIAASPSNYSWCGTEIPPPTDLFTVDMDVHIYNLVNTYGFQTSSSSQSYPLTINGQKINAIAVFVFAEGAMLQGWTASGDAITSDFYNYSGTITSIGIRYTSSAVILRINKTNTPIQFSGTFTAALCKKMDQLILTGQGTGTHIRFDNICIGPTNFNPNATTTSTSTTVYNTTTSTTIPASVLCSYLDEEFDRTTGSDTGWYPYDSNAQWTQAGGSLHVNQVASGKTSWYDNYSIRWKDFFTLDVDIDPVSIAGDGVFSVIPYSSMEYPFLLETENLGDLELAGVGVRVNAQNQVSIFGWTVDSTITSTSYYQPSEPITSIGIQYDANAITIRVNKKNTSIYWWGNFTSRACSKLDTLSLGAREAGTEIYIDKICTSPLYPCLPHPADKNTDYRIDISEMSLYYTAWIQQTSTNPIPDSYIQNAITIWEGGEAYDCNPAATPPWKPAAELTRMSRPGRIDAPSVLSVLKTPDRPTLIR